MTPAGVPLLDLKAQFEPIAEDLLAAAERVIRSQQFILGPEVEGLERELATYCGVKHVLGVSSGSDALILALMAYGIGAGDEVICPSYTFFATAGAVSRVGAKPVFVDIDPFTFNIDAPQLATAITSRTKAIIPVHLYGRLADMRPIMAIARERRLAVIEDACQAIGAGIDGRQAGSIGDVGCFSFFPSKNLGGFGDGGAVTTNDTALYEKMKSLRVHGERVRYHHQYVGANFRIDALQAAVLRVKLKHLDAWTEARRRNALHYTKMFAELGVAGPLVATPDFGLGRHVMNQYVIRATERDALREYLTKLNIGTQIYYPIPLHRQECFANLGYAEGSLPESERAARQTLALPIYPELTSDQIRTVVKSIANFYRDSGRLHTRAAA